MTSNGRVHFIGIGGIGMSGIARLLLQRGVAVSGSDAKESPITRELVAKGALFFAGHAAANVHGATEVVVSSAIRQDNPELVEARRLGLPEKHRSIKLADLVNSRRGITIAGTHGKTTTTSMAATMLSSAGLFPSYVVGGIIQSFADNARASDSEWIVIEADESDGTLVNYRPQIAVLTNVELDHTDFYKSMKQLDGVFATYLRNIKPGGICVCCADDPGAARILAGFSGRDVITYGLNGTSDISAREIRHDGLVSRFEVWYRGDRLGLVQLQVPGRHNVLNSLGAVGVGIAMEVPFDAISDGLGKFTGVDRRFQILGRANGITVVDDYAHHPSEIRATLAAARQAHGGRIVAVFQPHRFSRVQSLWDDFGAAFGDADEVVLVDTYPACEDPIPGVTTQLIADSARAHGHRGVNYPGSLADTEEFVMGFVRPGDLLLTLGAGDLVRTAHTLARRLAAPETQAEAV